MQLVPRRSYRATLVPTTVLLADAELKAGQGVLPTIQLKARDHGHAAALAHHVTGLHVWSVDRRDEVQA